jgi:hypothetical protein
MMMLYAVFSANHSRATFQKMVLKIGEAVDGFVHVYLLWRVAHSCLLHQLQFGVQHVYSTCIYSLMQVLRNDLGQRLKLLFGCGL